MRIAIQATIPILLLTFCFAQIPDTLWTKVYGGQDSDLGRSVQQTSDGGYIITGMTQSYGNGGWDVYLVKTDSIGDTLWTHTYGGGPEDVGCSVQHTIDGGYIVSGWTYSFGPLGYSNIYLIRTDALGDTLWTRAYGSASHWDYSYSVIQLVTGEFIVCGSLESDVCLLKIDTLGDVLWTKKYGGSNYDAGCSVNSTADGGFIIAGWTMSYGSGNDDAYLIKTDSQGDTLWTRVYGSSERDRAYCVQVCNDGGYIVVGENSFDAYVIRTDSLGDSLWTRKIGGGGQDFATSIALADNQGYVFTGHTMSFGPGSVWLVRLDENGDTLWTKTYGSATQDGGFSVQRTTDGGYIIAGQRYAGDLDIYLIKIEHDMTGFNEQQIAIRKKDYHLATIITGPLLFSEDQIFKVFDITGREVKPHLLRSGIYFIEMDGKITQKVIKVR